MSRRLESVVQGLSVAVHTQAGGGCPDPTYTQMYSASQNK